MLNSNAKKKISLMSVLFSLLFLFTAVNFGLCCSASYSEDDNPNAGQSDQEKITIDDDFLLKSSITEPINVDLTKSETHEEDKEESGGGTTEITEEDAKLEEEEKHENEQTHKEEEKHEDEQTHEESSSKSRRRDLCPFLCNIF